MLSGAVSNQILGIPDVYRRKLVYDVQSQGSKIGSGRCEHFYMFSITRYR